MTLLCLDGGADDEKDERRDTTAREVRGSLKIMTFESAQSCIGVAKVTLAIGSTHPEIIFYSLYIYFDQFGLPLLKRLVIFSSASLWILQCSSISKVVQ